MSTPSPSALFGALVIALCAAGCVDAPDDNPVWCPPSDPFFMQGPTTITVGYGTVWASNSTGVYRFTVPPNSDDARMFCEDAP